MRPSMPHRDHSALCIAFAGIISLAVNGCGTTEQQVQTIVHDAAVAGPVFAPPVNVVTDNSKESLTFSVHAGVMKGSLLEGVVEGSEPARSAWLYHVDTMQVSGGGVVVRKEVPSHNLTWQQSDFTAGARLDLAWKSVALSFGAGLSNSAGSLHGNWSAGLGLCSRDSGSIRARFDMGIFGQALRYDARTVTITTTTTSWLFGGTSRTVDTAYYHDVEYSTGIGYYGSVMINTAKTSWPVNFFVQGSFVVQPILSYKPYSRTTVDWLWFMPVESETNHGEVSTNAFFAGVTPGIYFEPSPDLVLIAGVKYLFETSDTFSGQTSMILPFVQVGLRTGL